MEKQLKCKVCGYIITEKGLGEVCPACGVPKTAFVEYIDKVSAKRRKILKLNLHLIIVHFPQAIAVMVFGLLLISLILSDPLKGNFMVAVKVLTILLPLSVFAGLASGLMDGKTRFKKLKTPVLKLKITVGILFLLLSSTLALSVICAIPLVLWIFLLLSANNAVFSAILGHNGGKLRGLAVPN